MVIVISCVYCEAAAEGKLWEKKNVSKWHLNMCNDGEDVTCAGAVRSRREQLKPGTRGCRRCRDELVERQASQMMAK